VAIGIGIDATTQGPVANWIYGITDVCMHVWMLGGAMRQDEEGITGMHACMDAWREKGPVRRTFAGM
jgi:hypothetical protein